VEEILEGYPTLNRQRIVIAPLYMRAFPRRGRPSRRPWQGKKARGRKSFPLSTLLSAEVPHRRMPAESLVGVAHAASFEATHVNHLGLSGQPDWALADRIIKASSRSLQITAWISFNFWQDGSAFRPDYPCSNVVPSFQRALFTVRFTTCPEGVW